MFVVFIFMTFALSLLRLWRRVLLLSSLACRLGHKLLSSLGLSSIQGCVDGGHRQIIFVIMELKEERWKVLKFLSFNVI